MAKRTIEELNLMDDFLFQEVLSDEKEGREAARLLLSIIMDQPIGEVSVKTQNVKSAGNPEKRCIRMDVYLEEEKAGITDQSQCVYDIEVQNADTKNLPRRTRYYQALIDAGMLRANRDYKCMKNLRIILITPVDLFGYGRMCYTFENRCEEIPELSLSDGAKRIFLYTKGKADDRKELADILHYMEKSCEENAVTPVTRKLHQIVDRVKHNEEVGVRYMKAIEYEDMIRERAVQEGMREGLQKGLQKGMEEGLQKGMKEGLQKGLQAFVMDNLEEGVSEERIIEKLQKRFQLTEGESRKYYKTFSETEK